MTGANQEEVANRNVNTEQNSHWISYPHACGRIMMKIESEGATRDLQALVEYRSHFESSVSKEVYTTCGGFSAQHTGLRRRAVCNGGPATGSNGPSAHSGLPIRTLPFRYGARPQDARTRIQN